MGQPIDQQRISAQEILDFWFEPGGEKRWFKKSASFDDEIRQRFLIAYKDASAGRLSDWEDSATGALALVLLLDQFPRNMYRDNPQAFASDNQALAIARHAVERGFDEAVSVRQAVFFYMPFEHSEALADQDRCVELMIKSGAAPASLDYALRHQEIIKRFGRFPHRNAILGRKSTAEEEEFLKQPGSGF